MPQIGQLLGSGLGDINAGGGHAWHVAIETNCFDMNNTMNGFIQLTWL